MFKFLFSRGLPLLCCMLLSAASFAGDSTGTVSTDSLMSRFKTEWDMSEAPAAVAEAGRSETSNLSPEMLHEYQRYAMKNVERVFNWHLYSTIIIFFMVLLIVISGLYLSYRQFRMQENAQKRGRSKLVATESAADGVTTLELGKDGLKINSAVIGLIILTISLGFFFLYLKYVYPVQVLGQMP